MNSILDISVSCFKDCITPDGPQEVNLLTWLRSDKYADKVQEIRSTDDKDKRTRLKKLLPAITPSGTFSRREAAALISHSGFLSFDVDEVDDVDAVKDTLSRIANVAYVGLSVSGRGVWGLVPLSYPDKHLEQFRALSHDLSRYGITLDKSCSNVDRLRIYSYDPDGYFNHMARPYSRLHELKAAVPVRPANDSNTREAVEKLIAQLTSHRVDITGDYSSEWFRIAAALAHEFAEAGRGYFHEISRLHENYSPGETDQMYSYCLKRSYNKVSIATLFHIAKNYNVTYV